MAPPLLASQPSSQLRTGAVTLNRRIHGSHVDGWGRGVFDCERSRRATAVAAVVRGSEGHGSHARRTAVVAQGVEVVAPGYVAACIGLATAAAGEPTVRSAALPAPSTQPSHPWQPCRWLGPVSSIVNVAVVLLLLPQSSVAVKVTVMPVAPQSSLKASKSLLQVTSLHASDAMAPPLLASQSVGQLRYRRRHTQPSHPWRAMSMAGAVVSSIVNVAVVLLVAAVVRGSSHGGHARCSAIVAQGRSRCSRLRRCMLEAAAPPLLSSHAVEVAAVAGAVTLNRRIHGGHVDGWGVVSSIVNVAVVLLLPQLSVAVKVTVAMPVARKRRSRRRSVAPGYVAACVRSQRRRCSRATPSESPRCRRRHTQPSRIHGGMSMAGPWCLRL